MKIKINIRTVLLVAVFFLPSFFSSLPFGEGWGGAAFAQLPNRGCGTVAPDAQYDALFQQKVLDYLNQTATANRTQALYQIPVIIHVIHNGEALGTLPNIEQLQLNSQIQVLNEDYGGTGLNSGTYPSTAFQTYATNTVVIAPASKDTSGRIGISNTGISFCLALKDSLGTVLPESGIERIHWNTIAGASNPTTFTTSGSFINFMNTVIKPATIWSPDKYLNIWVSDVNTSIGLIGFATFPPFAGLSGITAGGTATTDGLWIWAKSFGSQYIYGGGTYSTPYNYGRTTTHELSHYLGIRHTWGDTNCGDDYCKDTPGQQAGTIGLPIYPYLPYNCTSTVPPTGPEGIMFMNFADYTDDAGMYMFTDEQKIRMQTAMTNSPYRNQLGIHGFCNSGPLPPVANFSLSDSIICQGQSVSITNLSTPTGSISSWNYTCQAASPATSTVPNPIFTFNSSGTFTITLTVMAGAGGSNATTTKTIQVNPPTSVTNSSQNVSCFGLCNGSATVTANGSGPFTYSWSPGGDTTQSVMGLCPGTYTCVVINSCGISISSAVSIFQPSAIVLNPSISNPSVCTGNSSTLSVNPTGGQAPYNYNWSTGAISNLISVTPVVVPTSTYNVIVTDTSGCTASKTFSLTTYSLPNVAISPSNTTICSGQSLVLTALGASTYTWNTGFVGNTISVSPSTNMTYSVIGKSTNGCKNSATSNINVVPTPNVSISSPSTNVCFGYTMTLTASGATNFQWFNGTTANTTTVQPISNSTYTVIGNNGGACADTAFLPITILPLPSVSASVNTTLACVGQTINLTASGTANTYTWMPGFLQGPTQTVQINTPTTFTAYGQGTNGCIFFSTAFVDINASTNVIPVATPSAVCIGDTAVLSVIGGTVPSWSSNSVPNTSIVTPTINTTYSVSAIDFNGCVSDIVFYVDINSNCDIITYNGFTPNGDGINDFWIIDNIEKYPNNKVYIYNRWGNKIFETLHYDNKSNNWDGKLNGKAVTSGTYFYIIINNNEKLFKKGWIEITN